MIDAPHVTLHSSRLVRRPLAVAAIVVAAVVLPRSRPAASSASARCMSSPCCWARTAGPPGLVYLGGLITSALVLLGTFTLPFAATPWFVFANRAIALSVIWTTVFALVRSREASLQLEERTRALADVNYAF
jgi:hypothetical protein